MLAKEKLLDAEQTQKTVEALIRLYPQEQTELEYGSDFQLVCAVVLSAQATDKGVNKATPGLFTAYPTPEAMMEAPLEDIQDKIKTIGLYKNKAKFLKNLSRMLVEDFGGEIPQNRTDLMKLPGVGRKTANVVLTNAFGIPAFAVDTHVERVTKRLRMVPEDATVIQVEKIMMDKLKEEDWYQAHHSILLFGRYQCMARKNHDHLVCLERIKSEFPDTPEADKIFEILSEGYV